MGEDSSDLGHAGARNGPSASGRGTVAWLRAAAAGLSFRSAEDADIAFLARLYASTRIEELAVTGWSDGQKNAFLQMQFNAQRVHYDKYYAGIDFLVIELAGEPVGRLYLARGADQHRIVDVALLPEHRGRGLGAALLLDLLDEASRAGKSVAIHVEKFNPAMRLYQRLGFRKAGDEGVYDLMNWDGATRPPGHAGSA